MNQPIDARGLSCPQPVIMLKQALDKKPASLQILLDNRTSLENTTRYAESAGYHAKFEETQGEFLLTVTK